jgi:dihydroorotate dehydrogenase (fumarate)
LPLSNTLDGVRRLADAGVGAIVLHSLFEEQLRNETEQNARLADDGTDSFANRCPTSLPTPPTMPARAGI